jgi:lipid II:glycine glycyltransferase (peptidoglycan interpeptide bridge formation enzyme)
MSFDAHRDKMPNYLLQWEAIRWAKELGCHRYDLWGAPDRFDPSDPLWGVYRFKDGFPASVVRTIGAWDFAPNPLRYQLYHRLLPPALSLMRFLGRRQTQRTARQESWDE